MSDMAKDKAARMLKRRGSISSLSSHEVRAKEFLGKSKDSMSTVSYMDEPGHDIPRLAIRLENTYQLEIAPVGSEVSGEESQPAKPNLRSPLNPAYLYTRSIHPIGSLRSPASCRKNKFSPGQSWSSGTFSACGGMRSSGRWAGSAGKRLHLPMLPPAWLPGSTLPTPRSKSGARLKSISRTVPGPRMQLATQGQDPPPAPFTGSSEASWGARTPCHQLPPWTPQWTIRTLRPRWRQSYDSMTALSCRAQSWSHPPTGPASIGTSSSSSFCSCPVGRQPTGCCWTLARGPLISTKHGTCPGLWSEVTCPHHNCQQATYTASSPSPDTTPMATAPGKPYWLLVILSTHSCGQHHKPHAWGGGRWGWIAPGAYHTWVGILSVLAIPHGCHAIGWDGRGLFSPQEGGGHSP
ncbi:dynein light chain Tctex-type 5 isoform X1 [Carettochelys insculpta]|uniref:dynein light chain Tctex-type 5 isoform X1 n=1 Tax=Carettochelys insculpta TaxID=44489 RepID=UPI003EB891E2